MDPVTIVAAVTATIKLYQELAGDEHQRRQWEERLAAAAKLGAGAVDALGELFEEVSEATLLKAQRARAEKARAQNPAFYRGAVGAVLLVLALGLTVSCGGSGLTRLEARPGVRAGYAQEWPADASRNPEDFRTVEIDGRMITTVPVGE